MTITVRYFASLREALGTDERIAHHAGATLGSSSHSSGRKLSSA